MQRLTFQLTENLYQDLTLKAQEHKLSISEIIRECLLIGLKNFREETSKTSAPNADMMLQKRTATHTLFTYCLLEHFVKSTVENGEQLCAIAESKAEKLTTAMLQKAAKSAF